MRINPRDKKIEIIQKIYGVENNKCAHKISNKNWERKNSLLKNKESFVWNVKPKKIRARRQKTENKGSRLSIDLPRSLNAKYSAAITTLLMKLCTKN